MLEHNALADPSPPSRGAVSVRVALVREEGGPVASRRRRGHSSTVNRRITCSARLGLLLPGLFFLACSGDPQPDPPDVSAGAGGVGSCPNDLPSSSQCGEGAPSYRADAAPIIERRCSGCHFPGNSQSEDELVDYEGVYSRRQTVLTRVYSCVMPPAEAAPLTPEERATLLEWLVCGAQRD